MKMDIFREPKSTKRLVNTYTLMHGDDTVLVANVDENRITVEREDILPFALRNQNITVLLFMEWLNKRIDNLSRTYMNKVYIARKVGRDRELILKDSCAISVIDNFWIKRPDISVSWRELQKIRDTNLELVNTALTGVPYKIDFSAFCEDTTSLFTIKGAFPKAVYRGHILKKGSNAEYEFVASQLGKVLEVNTAEVSKQSDDIVSCLIFTNEEVSMVHVSDLLHFTDYYKDNNRYRAIYEYFLAMGRTDLVSQFERLFIFNYLVINNDLHEENMGILYNSADFKFIGVAPSFDFNSAFEAWEATDVYDQWIYKNLPAFMQKHGDIRERLLSAQFYKTLFSITELTREQKECVWNRATYLVNLCS